MAAGFTTGDEIKEALVAGSATVATVTALRGLLGISSAQRSKLAKPNISQDSSQTATNQPRRRKNVATQVCVCEHSAPTLSPKRAYALATEVVNVGLRALSAASKAKQDGTVATSSPSTTDGPQQHVLQPRSGNSSPTRTAKKRPTAPPPRKPKEQLSVSLLHTAECARAAFQYLRMVCPESLGAKALPPWQLETGMLSLAGKLVALGFVDAALRELYILKKRLESAESKRRISVAVGRSMKELLPSLLLFSESLRNEPEAHRLALSHQLLILKIVALLRDPTLTEAIAPCLRQDRSGSPLQLILGNRTKTGYDEETRRQSAALAKVISSLLPHLSATSQSKPSDIYSDLSAAAIFELQISLLVLQDESRRQNGTCENGKTRRWSLFSTHVETYLRIAADYDMSPYESAAAFCEQYGLRSTVSPEIDCLRAIWGMSLLAEATQQMSCALVWAEHGIALSKFLEFQDVRRLASLARYLCCHSGQRSSNEGDEACTKMAQEIAAGLRKHSTSHSRDVAILIAEIARLVEVSQALPIPANNIDHLLTACSTFAQHCLCSGSIRDEASTLAIIDNVVRCSRSIEQIQSWVSPDLVKSYLRRDTLRASLEAASIFGEVDVWMSDPIVFTFDRILHALIFKHLRTADMTPADMIIDDEAWNKQVRTTLLERQLTHCSIVVAKAKYEAPLQALLPILIGRILGLYTASNQSLRRISLLTTVLSLHNAHPAILPSHALDSLLAQCVVDNAPVLDEPAMQPFAQDILAAYATARALHEGVPSCDALLPQLLTWHSIIDSSTSMAELQAKIFDIQALVTRLRMVLAYFVLQGDNKLGLLTMKILHKLHQLAFQSGIYLYNPTALMAELYLTSGSAEKAASLLSEAEKISTTTTDLEMDEFEVLVSQADCQLAMDKYDTARKKLREAEILKTESPSTSTSTGDRVRFQLLRSHAWLVHSKLQYATGSPADALRSAKTSVKFLNAVWARLEQQDGDAQGREGSDISFALASEIDTNTEMKRLTTGVSKLQLSARTPASTVHKAKGAAFWPLIPLLIQALLHLSDMYVHHGVYADADYYSQRAIVIADSVQSGRFMSRVQIHRARLLTLADRPQDAELCLAKAEASFDGMDSLLQADFYRAKAGLRVKERALEEANTLFERARYILESIPLEEDFDGNQNFTEKLPCTLEQVAPPIPRVEVKVRAKKVPCTMVPATRRTRPAKSSQQSLKPTKTGTPGIKATCVVRPRNAAPYIVNKLKLQIAAEHAVTCLVLGHVDEAASILDVSQTGSFEYDKSLALAHARQWVSRAITSMEVDVTYNSLLESSLAQPAFSYEESRLQIESSYDSRSKGSKARRPKQSPVQPGRRGIREDSAPRWLEYLATAEKSLTRACKSPSSTSTTYSEYSLRSSVSILMSAAAPSVSRVSVSSQLLALHLEHARIYAVKGELEAVNTEIDRSCVDLGWPVLESDLSSAAMDADDFQSLYVDILPSPWTVVSLCMNGDCTELYVARYQAGQAPLILRLPFSRHKMDIEDEEVFDYRKGKAELLEIIDASNFSCHNTNGAEGKNVKKEWWSTREALDRRLHELLINIENVWFGGFKGVFLQSHRRPEAFARFRSIFEAVLTKHLPSRRAQSTTEGFLSFQDNILQLFISLTCENLTHQGVGDLVTDLLYFIVDMLQFNGEHNAYDEVDFEGMANEMANAIRAYHEAAANDKPSDKHLVLVLEKRLQAFPWESLPCLDGASVSRVSDMSSLRDRILAMRRRPSSRNNSQYSIGRGSGTYILNPSKDLTNTQSALSPSLSHLTQTTLDKNTTTSSWTAITARKPTEPEFRSALISSSILLYFGHGAGTQYIRPRSIRKLDRCSKVVWLMGCSSGAVTEYGEFEPFAVPLSYLMAGPKHSDPSKDDDRGSEEDDSSADGGKCMAVLATLWDVTDKDIDRFSLAVGEEWGLWPASEAARLPTKTPRKKAREVLDGDPTTPKQVPKTPKTPRVGKTAAAIKTSGHCGRQNRAGGGSLSLSEAVAKSRDVCYLRYLNGAAPVVYGVPVYLGDE